jgi:sigma-B regulation protein RsbU (phosphoserine phosphatase)
MEEGQFGVVVGDVAGKGVPAALYGAFASGTVRSRAFERHSPAGLMARVNRTLRRRGVEGLLCNLVYARFDLHSKTVVLASSGLPHPLHYHAATGRCVPIDIGGLPLGAFDTASYEEQTLALEPGDVFVFYTTAWSTPPRAARTSAWPACGHWSRPMRACRPPAWVNGSWMISMHS